MSYTSASLYLSHFLNYKLKFSSFSPPPNILIEARHDLRLTMLKMQVMGDVQLAQLPSATVGMEFRKTELLFLIQLALFVPTYQVFWRLIVDTVLYHMCVPITSLHSRIFGFGLMSFFSPTLESLGWKRPPLERLRCHIAALSVNG